MPCDNDKKEHKCCHDFEESACPCANGEKECGSKKESDNKKEGDKHEKKGCDGGCGGGCHPKP